MADPNDTLDPEPVDAEFEPARDLPDPDSQAARRKGVGAGTVLAFFILASLAGGGLGYAAARYLPATDTTATDTAGETAMAEALGAMQTRLTALEAEDPAQTAEAALTPSIAALNARIELLESRPEATPGLASPDLTPIEARLTALETAPAPVDTQSEQQLTARLDQLESDLVSLDALARQALDTPATGEQAAIDPLILQNLSERLSALETAQDLAATAQPPAADPQTAILAARLDQLETELAETRALAETAQSSADTAFAAAAANAAARPAADTGQASRQLAARALALSALRDIAGTHEGFEAERAALAQVWRGNTDLAAMASYARAGVPTLDDLTASYPGDAIREAAGPGRIFFGLIEVRQASPGAGDTGAMAISALAESRLAVRDLEGAIALTERLDETALPAARDWLLGAQARLDLDRRLIALRQALADAAAQGDDPS